MGKQIDVLADLRGVVRIAKAASHGVTGNVPRIAAAERAIAAVAELVAAAEAMEERIAYYAEMGESAEVNIEDWAYTDNSGDMARLRAALAPFQTGGAA